MARQLGAGAELREDTSLKGAKVPVVLVTGTDFTGVLDEATPPTSAPADHPRAHRRPATVGSRHRHDGESQRGHRPGRVPRGRSARRTPPAADLVALLHEVVRGVAREHPERTALVHDGSRLTFAALDDRIARAAAVAAELAPPAGRIAAIGPNHPTWIELYHGVPASGRVLVFLNHRLAGSELTAPRSSRSGAIAVVGAAEHLGRLRSAGVELPIARLGRVGIGARRRPPPYPPGAGDDLDPARPAWLIYTSGTTAAPKGAMLTHTSILAAVAASTRARPVESDDVYLFPFPLCHVAGYNVVHRHAHGRPVVLVDGFDPASFCAAVAAEGVTSTSVAATMLAALLDHVAADPAARRQLATLRTDGLRRGTDGAVPAAAGPRRAGRRSGPGLRDDRALRQRGVPRRRRPPARPRGRRGSAPSGGHARSRGGGAHRRRGRTRPLTAGGARRDPRPRATGDGRLLGRPGRPRRPRSGAGGCTPATSAGSTPTASSTSSTAART